ncbi:MAG TPA: class I SAM-dependent methyltransferase, partial [Gammaproteobacteria bacterium]|nr:class I SAM-dependent methyltransferase [Gammaproteobacteria bacterium]
MGETAIGLQSKGFTVDAVDDSEKAIGFLKENYPDINWFCSNVSDFVKKIPDSTYDVITLYHVLEHLPHPQHVIPELYRSLEEGGLLVVEVPNFNGMYRRLLGKRWQYWLDHHVNYFTIHTLKELLG